MSQTTTTSSGGIGICGLLGVSFVVLKLCDVIQWSWWWVTAPFWLPISVVATVVLLVVLGLAVWHGTPYLYGKLNRWIAKR